MPELAHPRCAMLTLLQATDQGPLPQNYIFVRNGDPGTFTSGQLQDMLDAAITNYPLTVGTEQTNHLTFVGARIQSIHEVPYGPVYDEILATPDAGSHGGDAAPYSVCAVVQFICQGGDLPRRSYVRHAGLA